MNKIKTNLVKSFMRSGVFALNPNAIARSRILQSAATDLDSRENERTSHDGTPPGDRDRRQDADRTMHDIGSSSRSSVAFSTYRSAIIALDEVIDGLEDDSSEVDAHGEEKSNPTSSNSETIDDDDDEDFLPMNARLEAAPGFRFWGG